MTNGKRFKDKILSLSDGSFSVVEGEICECKSGVCDKCEFFRSPKLCTQLRFEWLYKDYQEGEHGSRRNN